MRTRGLKVKVSQQVGMKARRALLDELLLDLRRGSGAVVIASAGATEHALESDVWKNGAFTFAFLDGLKSGRADEDQDGVLRVSKLRDCVSTLTGGMQRPTTRREPLDLDDALPSLH